MAHYQRHPPQVLDQLEEYFRITTDSPQDFGTCNPFEWWQMHSTRLGNVYQLACDILSIPGIFSALQL
jgi:hypothetical protein